MRRNAGESTIAAKTAVEGLLHGIPLTDVDYKIIAHLQEDGRRTFKTIAQDIGVTEKTVRAHVKSLLEQQIIQIVALTSPNALGYFVCAMAAVYITSPAHGTRIADALARIDSIDYVVLTYGRFSILAEIVARDMAQLQATIEKEIGAIDGVSGVEIFPYYSIHYQEARIFEPRAEEKGGLVAAELTGVDRAIAVELNRNGRMAFTAVGARLGISEGQVRQRVQMMIDERKLRIMAILNPLKLLDRTMAWVALRVAPNKRPSDLADALSSMPNTSYVALCTGRYDIFAEVICSTQGELMEIVEQNIRPLDGISHVEVFIYANLHYKRLLPIHTKDQGANPKEQPPILTIHDQP
ncbi:MAG: AsnC family transcriptional regulator [Pseudomonadota bacterium]